MRRAPSRRADNRSPSWYLLGNVILFLICSGMCGVSYTLTEMIVCRVGQGFTGGVFIPAALTVVVTMMPHSLQPVGTAMFGLTAALGPAVGPYIGGWLTDHVGWKTRVSWPTTTPFWRWP